MNRYPTWVNVLVLVICVAGVLLALPNFFGDDPALHVSRPDGTPVQSETLDQIESILGEAGIDHVSAEIEENAALVRFPTVNAQLRANDLLRAEMPDHVVALTLAPRTPPWLAAIGLKPMALGLDLRGGVHFLYQVDIDAAVDQLLASYESDLRAEFREARIRSQLRVDNGQLLVSLQDPADLTRAEEIIRELDEPQQLSVIERLIVERTQVGGRPGFRVRPSEALIRERQDFSIQQNTITLRNRVDELGVSEPVVQRQGLDRILVQLPGIQDPAQAERVLGATATLEFRLVDIENDVFDAAARGRSPIG